MAWRLTRRYQRYRIVLTRWTCWRASSWCRLRVAFVKPTTQAALPNPHFRPFTIYRLRRIAITPTHQFRRQCSLEFQTHTLWHQGILTPHQTPRTVALTLFFSTHACRDVAVLALPLLPTTYGVIDLVCHTDNSHTYARPFSSCLCFPTQIE